MPTALFKRDPKTLSKSFNTTKTPKDNIITKHSNITKN